MARDYGTRRSPKKSTNAPHQFLVIAVTFLLGYFTASIFDIEKLSHWVNNQVLAPHEAKPETAAKPAAHTAQLPPKPKFEFYTLLAKEKGSPQAQANNANHAAAVQAAVKASTALTAASKGNSVAAAKPPVTPQAVVKVAEGRPLASSQVYSVQVAAFKARSDAEQMKGLLTLKGYDVSIIALSQARGTWYRVVVGPYANRKLAQQAQSNLARNERLHGMVKAL